MRLIFIPGFGETPSIFSQLAERLPGEKLFVDNLDLLGIYPKPALTVAEYARQLIECHRIQGDDVIIGHSMGGWIALAIKQHLGCPIVQIASWTDPTNVFLPIKNPTVVFWLIRHRWYFNQFTKQLLLRLGYRHKPSARVFSQVFQNLIDSSPEFIVNQVRLILSPLNLGVDLQPDLRIHSVVDSIVRFPAQAVVTVPGDHFNLFTHSQEVADAIVKKRLF